MGPSHASLCYFMQINCVPTIVESSMKSALSMRTYHYIIQHLHEMLLYVLSLIPQLSILDIIFMVVIQILTPSSTSPVPLYLSILCSSYKIFWRSIILLSIYRQGIIPQLGYYMSSMSIHL